MYNKRGDYKMFINTNKIKFNIKDFELKYDVFKITVRNDSEIKYLPKRSKIIPRELSAELLSVYNYSGKCMYLLFHKDEIDLQQFHDLPKELEICKDNKIYQDVKLNLLLNSLTKYKNDAIFNISGHFLQWVKNTKNKRVYLEYRFYQGILQQSVVTYTQVDEVQYQVYYAKGNDLCEDPLDAYDALYIKKGDRNHKNRIRFINVENIGKYQNTKVYLFSQVIKLIETYLNDILVIDSLKEEYNVIRWEKPKGIHKNMLALLSHIGFHIVNLCEDKQCTDQLIYLMMHAFDKKNINENDISVGQGLDKNKINIRIIHNSDYYKNNKLQDDHIASINFAIQHITLEELTLEYNDFTIKNKKRSNIGQKILFEGLIKYEIIHKTFHLATIENAFIQEEWKYYMKENDQFYLLQFKDHSPEYQRINAHEIPDELSKNNRKDFYAIETSDHTFLKIEENLKYHPLPDFKIIENRLYECSQFDFIDKSELIRMIESFEKNNRDCYEGELLNIFTNKIKDLLNNLKQLPEKEIDRDQIKKIFPSDRKKPYIKRKVYQFIYEQTGKRVDAELEKPDVVVTYMGGHIYINYKQEYKNMYYTVGKISEKDFRNNMSTTNQIKKLVNCSRQILKFIAVCYVWIL